MENDARLATAMKDLDVTIPKQLGRSPEGWSWHHVPDRPGVMQLVPRAQHQGGPWQALLHKDQVGGFKKWGSDY